MIYVLKKMYLCKIFVKFLASPVERAYELCYTPMQRSPACPVRSVRGKACAARNGAGIGRGASRASQGSTEVKSPKIKGTEIKGGQEDEAATFGRAKKIGS